MAVVRIAGITIPANKRIEASLPYIHGIGFVLSKQTLKNTQIDPDKRTSELTEAEVGKLRDYIEKNFTVEGTLKQEVGQNIKRLKEIGSYRGLRHSKGLPVRGQRTKTNNRTVRGNVRKTAGSGRHKSAEKT